MIVLWKAYHRSPGRVRVAICVGPDLEHLELRGDLTLSDEEWRDVDLHNVDVRAVDETDKPKEFGP